MKNDFDANIISFDPKFVGKEKDLTRNIIYLKIPFRKTVQDFDYAIFLFLKLWKKIISHSLNYDYWFSKKWQMFILERALRKIKADFVLAVDMAALFLSQKIFQTCHFISLEIYPDDPYRNKIDVKKIASVVIQNQMRYEYLFGDLKLKTFFIQNAPVFKKGNINDNNNRKDLIWAGTIIKKFAVLDCLHFIQQYPQYKLMLKGGAEQKTLIHIKEQYSELIASGNVVIDQDYLTLNEFIRYLSGFKIGFCFYDWDLIHSSINYQTAPSGKLFMYLAAGVPVIACNIPGFQFVKEYNAGILIDDYNPLSIKNAVSVIEKSYEEFQKGCYEAAKYYSFDTSVEPYLKYLLAS
ncbi:MAG TPA: hypothetical protein VKT28_05855 [Puia sp.]|nr:hypothetical protein [Puia sp.]